MKQKNKERNWIKETKQSILGLLTLAFLGVLIVLALRAFTILTEAVEKAPPGVEKAMGPAFNFPMIKSRITFRFDEPISGVDIWKAIFGGTLSLEPGALRKNSRVLIPYSSVPLRLTISYLNALSPLGGFWRGESAVVEVKGAFEGKFQGEPANEKKKWGMFGYVKGRARTVTPFFRVSVPFNEANTDLEISERIIVLDAELRVTFPAREGMNWTDHTPVERSHLQCLLLSPRETQTYKKIHKQYLVRLALKTLPLYGGILLALIGIVVFIVRRCPKIFEE